MNEDSKRLLKVIINKSNAESIWTLALVSDTSYEVLFYAKINGELLQSNEMVEQGIIDIDDLDNLSKAVVKEIKEKEQYYTGKMNIVSFFNGEITEFRTDELNCSLFKARKTWKATIG